MTFLLNKRIFTILLAAMIVVIAVTCGLLILDKTGILSSKHPGPDTHSQGTEETGPWGSKSYTWEYQNTTHRISTYISREEYEAYHSGIPGATCPDNLTAYICTNADAGIVADIAAQLERINSRQGYTGDEDSVGCILSFVSSLAYRTDHETGHSSSYPRTPAVILAEEVGDSEDHTLLAAALMRELGYGIAILYYPATYDRLSLIPEAAALGLSTGEDHHGPAVYASRENSTQRAVISPFWTVNTEEQGIPTAAYNGISPIVYTDDSLWTGKMYQPGSGTILDLTNILQFKDSNELLYTPKDWQQNVSDYYRSVWYSTGVSWTLDDTWKVYEKIVAIEDIPGDLYTPWGTAVHNASVPWRLTYTVSKMDEDSVQDMTPYSDVRIAVCSLDPASGSITPIRVSGWQGLYRADKYQTIGPFAPGTYVIGVLVRNAEIKIALEYHGKQNSTAYLGGI